MASHSIAVQTVAPKPHHHWGLSVTYVEANSRPLRNFNRLSSAQLNPTLGDKKHCSATDISCIAFNQLLLLVGPPFLEPRLLARDTRRLLPSPQAPMGWDSLREFPESTAAKHCSVWGPPCQILTRTSMNVALQSPGPASCQGAFAEIHKVICSQCAWALICEATRDPAANPTLHLSFDVFL